MKVILHKMLMFSLPLLALWLVCVVIPIDKRLQYEYIKGECYNHGLWIHDRIFEDQRPIDIAFLGSSHSINGINDSLITQRLNESGHNLQAANLAYCRLGRNLTLVLLKDLLKKKRPKKIFIEVREDEDRYSHPVYPYIADHQELLQPKLLFNAHLLRDIGQASSSKIELLKRNIYHINSQFPLQKEPFGHGVSADTVSLIILAEAAEKRKDLKPLSKGARNFYMKFSRSYWEEIGAICAKENITVNFLYIPAYGSPWQLPQEHKTYKRYGKLLMPPKEIFTNKDHWHDKNHLNKAGATALSEWIALFF